MEVDMTLVHAAHCCAKHGCKYMVNSPDCPVEQGAVEQEHSCEFCDVDNVGINQTVGFIAAWLEKRIAELEAQWSDRSEPLHVQHAAMQRAHYYRDVVRGLREGAWKA